ncbi:hypothetical protein SOVF_045040, partial [Spinacia oleracea]
VPPPLTAVVPPAAGRCIPAVPHRRVAPPCIL